MEEIQPKRVRPIEPGTAALCTLCGLKGTTRGKNVRATFRLEIQGSDGQWGAMPVCGFHAGKFVEQGAT